VAKRTAAGIDQICLVECTDFVAGRSYSFDEASVHAFEHLKQTEEFRLALDVMRCRGTGIRPIPVRISEDGKFRTIGRDFMIRYFRVSQEDAVPTLLGTSEKLMEAAGSGDPDFLFLNQSGKGDSRYSEAALVAGSNYAYVISIMMSGETGFAYDDAVREISDYVFADFAETGAGTS
jgi:hypothetical protein